VDRWRDGAATSTPGAARRWGAFSIYDVDFVPIPTVETAGARNVAGLHWFGVVQYVGADRSADWCEFYTALFGFSVCCPTRAALRHPAGSGSVLASPLRHASSCS
jgi:4-hydroxyphenylpyruvate dioxygenase